MSGAVATVAVAPAPSATPTPLDDVAGDTVAAFTGTSLIFHGTAFATGAAMAFSGADHAIRVAFQRHLVVPAWADTANLAGYIVPAVTAPGLWLVGLATRNRTTTGAGAAAIQAVVLSLATTGVLKVALGRVYPLNGGDPNAPDRLSHPAYAHTFRPFTGLLAWPSGHTTGTISIAAALTAYYPESIAVPLVGYPVALAIGFGMVDGDRHWASDVVGGALIGHAIGYAVGRRFRARVRDEAGDADGARIDLVPISVAGGGGLGVAGSW